MNAPPPDANELTARLVEALEIDPSFDIESFLRDHPEHERELRARLEGLRSVGLLPRAAGEPLSAASNPLVAWLSSRDASPGGASEDVYERLFAALGRKRALFERYEIVGEIATGGMGRVLHVRDRELGRSMAMKVLRRSAGQPTRAADLVGRFFEEAQITAQLDHPGIVPVYDLGLDDQDNVYYTMRLVRGSTLEAVFAEARSGGGSWSRERILDALVRACDALAFAHERGVVHRDLKPSNIMVGPFGEVYVMDWGLAKVRGLPERAAPRTAFEPEPIESDRSRTTTPGSPLETAHGRALGTPVYMSPEQARGDSAAIGPRSDVFAMGAILYQLLAGFAPYADLGDARDSHELLECVLAGPPTPIERLARTQPQELLAICARAMSREPRERYADVRELVADLRAFLERRVVGAYRTGPVAELSKWIARNKAIAAMSGSALVLVLGGAFGFSAVQAKHRVEIESERDRALRERGVATTVSERLEGLASTLLAKQWTPEERRERLVDFAHQVRDDEQLSPPIRARLLHSVGEGQKESGDLAAAQATLTDALSDWRHTEPREHDREFQTLNALASVESELGRIDDALKHFEEALQAARDGGLDWADPVLMVYTNVIDAYLGKNDLAAAEPYAARVLEWLDAHDQRATPTGAAVLNQLGRIRRRQARPEEAAAMFREALEAFGDGRPATDPARLAMENNLAAALLESGHADQALEIANSVVERAERVYEPDHPTLVTFLETRASSLFALDRFAELEPISRRILETRRRMLSPEHPATLRSELNLASVLLRLDRRAEVAPLIDHALSNFEAQGLAGSLDHVRGVLWRARSRALDQQCEDAASDFRYVVERLDPDLSRGNQIARDALEELARLQLACKLFDEAAESARRVLAATPADDAKHAAREALVLEIRARIDSGGK